MLFAHSRADRANYGSEGNKIEMQYKEWVFIIISHLIPREIAYCRLEVCFVHSLVHFGTHSANSIA